MVAGGGCELALQLRGAGGRCRRLAQPSDSGSLTIHPTASVHWRGAGSDPLRRSLALSRRLQLPAAVQAGRWSRGL